MENRPETDILSDDEKLETWKQETKEKLSAAGITEELLREFLENPGLSAGGGENQALTIGFMIKTLLEPPKPPKQKRTRTKPVLELALPAEMLAQDYITTFSDELIMAFMRTSLGRLNGARRTTASGVTLEIGKGIKGKISTSAKKLFQYALLYLKVANFYKREDREGIIPIVEISLEEYGKLTGKHVTPDTMPTPAEQAKENARAQLAMKKMREQIRIDLHDLKKGMTWTAKIGKRSRNAGDYDDNMHIISSYDTEYNGNFMRIKFDVDAAHFFIKGYLTQFPRVLFSYDESKHNAFVIAYKIAIQHFMDANYDAGRNNTISVRVLLDVAPEIPTYEEIQKKNNRNWRRLIKETLEAALDESVKKGFLASWEYREPRTGVIFDPESADTLTYAQWYKLMVDFIVANEPDQTQRRAAAAERKRQAETVVQVRKAKKREEAEARKQAALPAPQETETDAEAAPEPEADAPKRGRPRKQIDPEAEAEAAPKRGRGRPRKNPPPEAAEADAEPPIKRKRGRPRKNQENE